MIENIHTDENRSTREKALVATFMMHGLDATRDGGLVLVLTGNTHQKMELRHERVTFWQIFPSRCRFVVCVRVSQNYRFIKRFHMHLKPAEAIYPCRCINMVKCAIRMSGCRIAGRKYVQLSCQPEHQELKTSRSGGKESFHGRRRQLNPFSWNAAAVLLPAEPEQHITGVCSGHDTGKIKLSSMHLIENQK